MLSFRTATDSRRKGVQKRGSEHPFPGVWRRGEEEHAEEQESKSDVDKISDVDWQECVIIVGRRGCCCCWCWWWSLRPRDRRQHQLLHDHLMHLRVLNHQHLVHVYTDTQTPHTQLCEWGLTSHSTHNRSFRGRIFPGNQLHWYW